MTSGELIQPSVVYQHLCAVVETTLRQRSDSVSSAIRIVDMGCGSGRLISLLHSRLRQQFPKTAFEIFGFDVIESKVQRLAFLDECLENLNATDATVDWKNRISLISASDPWPFDDESVDFVLSNQVLEHVNDHRKVFFEISRVMKPTGLSAHIFPLKSCFMELHVKLPFAHWIRPDGLLTSYIKNCSRLGLGTWKRYCHLPASVSLDEFAQMNRDFLAFETNYIDEKEIAAICKESKLRPSYEFTEDLYFNKMRSIFSRPLVYRLQPSCSVMAILRFKLLKRVSGITLTLSKHNSYVNHGFHTA